MAKKSNKKPDYLKQKMTAEQKKQIVRKGSKSKTSTRVRKAVASGAKSATNLSPKRSIKSRFYQDIKNHYIGVAKNKLTSNQAQFIAELSQAAEEVMKQAESLGVVLDIIDLIPMLPDMPVKITKKFLSKLLGSAIEEIMKQIVPEFNASWNKPYPKLSIMDRVTSWIEERIPDDVQYYSKGGGWTYQDMTSHKQFLSGLVTDHWSDADDGKAYAQHLLDNQHDLLLTIDHFPYISNQEDFEETISRLYAIISQNNFTFWGEMVVEDVNDVLSGGV